MRFFLLLLLFCTSSFAVRFEFKDAALRDLVHFVSDGALEKIVGTTGFVRGWVELNPEKLSDGAQAEFEIDLRTFETNSEMRNLFFREKVFNTAEFPMATFTLQKTQSWSKPKLMESRPITSQWEGILKARGVSKTQTIQVKMIYLKESDFTKQRLFGNLLKISASTDIDSNAFGVTLNEQWKARFPRYVPFYLDAVGTDKGAPLSPPKVDGPKPKEKKNP